MVALAILGLALTAILSAQAGLYGANVQARNLTQATSAARCKMSELEEHLMKKGFQETDELDEGPCCAEESPPGMTCRWKVERVTMPDPPQVDLLDAGAGAAGDAGGAGSALGPLGALAGAAANPGSLAAGGISALSSALSTPMGPGGQTGVGGIASMAMGMVYPQLKPLLEASIRRVTVEVMWNEGPNEKKLPLVLFVTHPQRGLPPIDPAMAGQLPGGMPGLPGAGGTATPSPNVQQPGAMPR